MDEPTDAEIIAAILAGDAHAFGALVDRYEREYLRFAVRMLGNRADADEALQRAFLRAYRALAQCHDPGRFGAWLYHIVANQCRTMAMQRARRERRIVLDDETLAETTVDHPGMGDGLREEIELALARLDVEQREAFLLKHIEGLSYDEMAEITGTGVSALKMRVKRGCERLRELLEGVRHG